MPRSNNQYQVKLGKSPKNRSRATKAAWVPDGLATRCYACRKQFGAFVRRHHCRACGNVFCSSDSSHKTPLHHLGIIEPVRVCDSCFASFVASNGSLRNQSQATSLPGSSTKSQLSSEDIHHAANEGASAASINRLRTGQHQSKSLHSSNIGNEDAHNPDELQENSDGASGLTWSKCACVPVSPGEELLVRANHVQSLGKDGVLVLTNFRLVWYSFDWEAENRYSTGDINSWTNSQINHDDNVSSHSLGRVSIPMLTIASVSCQLHESRDAGEIRIVGKDFRKMGFEFQNMVKRQYFKSYDLCLEILRTFAFPPPEIPFSRRYFATFVGQQTKTSRSFQDSDPDGWDVYNPMNEYTRIGALGKYSQQWRMSTVNSATDQFKLCSTYPQVLVIPQGISDSDLLQVASFRVRGRVPALSWLNKYTGASISRCSSPLVGIARRRNVYDEALIGMIAKSAPRRHVMIMDARPRVNAVASQVTTGAGYEIQEWYTNPGDDQLRLPDHAIESSSSMESTASSRVNMALNPSHRNGIQIQNGSSDANWNSELNSEEDIAGSAASTMSQWLIYGGGQESSDVELENADLTQALKETAVHTTNVVKPNNPVTVPGHFTASVEFLNLANIHTVRRSMRKLSEVALSDEISDPDWLSHLEATQWMTLCSIIMSGSNRVIQAIVAQNSVVLHCADGWDRTPQLTSLAMLCLDGYYRTVRGFQVLIEKEWLAFGHQFRTRHGTGLPADAGGRKSTTAPMQRSSNELSPVFVQWMDCVYQVMCQFPCAFEFNEELLVVILDHLYDGLYGTFLVDCEREREVHGIRENTVSLWSKVNANRERYLNPFYTNGLVEPKDHTGSVANDGSENSFKTISVPRKPSVVCACQSFVKTPQLGLPKHFSLSCCGSRKRKESQHEIRDVECDWSSQVLVPNCSAKVLSLWKGYFLRHDPTFQFALRPTRVVAHRHRLLSQRLEHVESLLSQRDQNTSTSVVTRVKEREESAVGCTEESTSLRRFNLYLMQCIQHRVETKQVLTESEFDEVLCTLMSMVDQVVDAIQDTSSTNDSFSDDETTSIQNTTEPKFVTAKRAIPDFDACAAFAAPKLLEKLRVDARNMHPLSPEFGNPEPESATNPENGIPRDILPPCPSRLERQTSSQSQDRELEGSGSSDIIHVPYWQPDDAASNCPVCTKSFGNFKRKHHCRKCGIIVCGSCSQHRVPLPRLGYYVPVRVCDMCLR